MVVLFVMSEALKPLSLAFIVAQSYCLKKRLRRREVYSTIVYTKVLDIYILNTLVYIVHILVQIL